MLSSFVIRRVRSKYARNALQLWKTPIRFGYPPMPIAYIFRANFGLGKNINESKLCHSTKWHSDNDGKANFTNSWAVNEINQCCFLITFVFEGERFHFHETKEKEKKYNVLCFVARCRVAQDFIAKESSPNQFHTLSFFFCELWIVNCDLRSAFAEAAVGGATSCNNEYQINKWWLLKCFWS